MHDTPDPLKPSVGPPTESLDSLQDAWVPLSSLVPPAGRGLLKGIARLAAGAVEIDGRNGVEYRDLPCRSLLSTCESRRVDFDYTINPYRGCEFGCAYCYARYTHEFMELHEDQAFERKIFVKTGAREALVRDLQRCDLHGKWIAIGSATDPYQPAERRYGLTRSLLEVLSRRRGLRLSITTKSDLVLRDVELLQRIAGHSHVHVNVTITTPHHLLARKLEPRAPRPDRRLAAVAGLSSAGISCGVFAMPVLPRITDGTADLEALVNGAAKAGASYLVAGLLFLRDCSRKSFFPFLREHFPELEEYYRHLYSYRGRSELAAAGREVSSRVKAMKLRYGLGGWPGTDLSECESTDQPRLALE